MNWLSNSQRSFWVRRMCTDLSLSHICILTSLLYWSSIAEIHFEFWRLSMIWYLCSVLMSFFSRCCSESESSSHQTSIVWKISTAWEFWTDLMSKDYCYEINWWNNLSSVRWFTKKTTSESLMRFSWQQQLCDIEWKRVIRSQTSIRSQSYTYFMTE